MQLLYFRWLLVACFHIGGLSLSAQVFQGQTNVVIPPGAPSQTVGISESDAVVSGVGPLTGCLRVERVLVNMTHTWTGDIGLFLISPAGTVLELSTRNGGSQNDYLNTTFRDDAAIFITDGNPPFTGTFRPEGRTQGNLNTGFSNDPLGTFTLANSFAGENADGTWTFLVNDYVAADIGEILNWEIEFAGDPNGTFDVDLGPDQSVCGGNSVVLSPTLNPSGSGATYSWSTGETTSTISVSPTVPTTYSVTVTSGGCTAEDEITVSPGAGNPVTITSPTQTICAGESVTLTASGGGPGATYNWSTGQSGSSITVSPTDDEVFSVTLTEAGCDSDDDILIQVQDDVSAIFAAVGSTLFCAGDQVPFQISFIGDSGGQTYTINVDNPSGDDFNLTNVAFTDGGFIGFSLVVNETSTLTLTLTPEGDACPATVSPDQVTITISDVDLEIAGPTEVCPGDPVTLTASGADTYTWSTGANTPSITEVPLITTTYTVTGTSNGCSATEEITVTALPPNPTVSSNPVQICEGQSSTLSITDVAPSATFQWSTGQTDQNISVTPATTTTYQVTVTDGPCSVISFISVLVDPAGTADLVVQGPDEVCAGETVDLLVDFDGSTNYGPFDLVIQNPNGPDFIINDFTGTGDPDVTASFVVNQTTTFTLSIVASGAGCPITLGQTSVTVTANDPPDVQITGDTEICPGENVTLIATGADTYLWSSGQTGETIFFFQPFDGQSISVTGTTNGCEDQAQAVITVVPLEAEITPSQPSICIGESITLTGSGGGPGASYDWSDGQSGQQITLSPTTSETITLTVTDGECSDTEEFDLIVNPPPAVVVDDDFSLCAGLPATLTALGGGFGSTFQWSTGQAGSTIDIFPLVTTTYTVTVTDNGCTNTDQVTVTVEQALALELGNNQELCLGDNTNLFNLNGVTGTYQWSTGENTPAINVSPDESQLYSVTLTDGNCSSEDQVLITVTDPSVDLGPDLSICPGESAVLQATGPGSFLWSTNETSTSIVVSPDQTETFTVTRTFNGCTATDEIEVIVLAAPAVSAGDDQTICTGESIILTASGTGPFSWSTNETADQITVSPEFTTTYTVTAGGSTCQATDEITVFVEAGPNVDLGPDAQICEGSIILSTNVAGDSYAWSTGSNQPSITVSPTGTEVYTLSVTDGGCTGVDSITVSLLDIEVDAGADQTICPGESITLTASGTNTYSWTDGPSSQVFTVSPTETTTYFVTGTNTAGCTDQDSVTVNVVLNTSVSIAPQEAICPGEEVVLTATGTGPFSWSTGEVADQITVQPDATTTFVAQAGAGACQVTDSIELQVQPPIVFDLGPDTTICAGQDLQLELAVAGAQYEWSNGSTSGSANYAPISPEIASVLVTVNGCTATDSLAIGINDPVLNVSNDTIICPGDEVQLFASGTDEFLWSTTATTGSILVSPTATQTYSVEGTTEGCSTTAEVTVTVSVPGNVELGDNLTICPGESVSLTADGTGPFTWSTNETGQEITVSPTETTVYTASIGTGNCLQADSVAVVVLPQVEAIIGPDTTICAGESLILTAQGTPGTYLWNTTETTQSIIVSPSDTTTYNLVTTANGCTDTTEITVTVNTPVIEVSTDTTVCPGDEVQLLASGTDSFSWSNGAATPNITVAPTSTEVFTVTGTDAGCSLQDSVRVEVRPLASLAVDADQSICAGEAITLTASSDGPLLWSTGESSPSIEVAPNASTTYSVVAGEGNCVVTDSIAVEVRPLPVVSISGESSACLGSAVSLQATGSAGATFSWSTGESTPAIDFVVDSDRQFTVAADLAGCQDSTSFEVMALALPEVANAEPVCDEDNATYQWSIALSGGTAPYFSDGEELSGNTLVSPSIASGDSILLSFTDANGCATSFDLSNACGCLVLPLVSPAPRCTQEEGVLSLSELLPPDAPEGVWTVISGPASLTVNEDQLITNDAPAGIYRLQFAPEGATLACLPDYEVSLELVAPASSGIQAVPLAVCQDASETVDLSLELVGLTPGGSWSGVSDNTNGNANFDVELGLFNTQGQAGGSYIFRYTTAEGGVCPSVSSDMQIDVREVLVEALTSSATCVSECSGAIEIVNPDPFFLYGINEDALSGNVLFDNLCPGNYRLVAEDPAGCQAGLELLVEEPVLPQLEVGLDRELLLGDSLRINVQTTAVDGVVSWSPEVNCQDPACLEVILQPIESTLYTLELIDGDGCTARDDLRVFVDRNRTAYAPTAFSPNGDGTNDRFTIYGDAGTVRVRDVSVFDRWGNRLFFAEELPLNDEAAGWDGRANGQVLNSGVFVYQFRAVWLDGREETISGEVAIMK